ncbi:toprim domain-containing protein [Vibrio parahaemolyticus]|uniref:Putative replication protein RepA n=3 Tax=root TaxID=1 RepID=Q6R4V1_9CAUD|nr:replication [Vibrio phage VP882]AAS38505.1 putative replication protein RepA [Vibrio phage VP882]MCF9732976.1 toprim domain-containing protein [Vibrio parahaemolyticus]MCF9748080.1 toprim domain-containing protein [Vibrio parahaemolyticus]MCF9901318.1 toprim domain-containing protein [Vibrio parahaemolyticus]
MSQDKRTTLQGFYQERFNSDPYALLDYCGPEVADKAAQVQIDWSSIAGNVQLNDAKYRGKVGTLKKDYRGKVAVYGSIKRTAGGIEYPHINFTTAKDGGYTETFDGYKALLEIYEREKGVQLDPGKQKAWKQEQERKRRAREARLAAIEAQEKKRREQRLREHLAYQDAFIGQTAISLPRDTVRFLFPEDGSFDYLQRKEISEVANVVSLKRMQDKHGEFVAVQVHDVHGNYLGLQRLYDRFKKFTVAVDDHQFDGAHCIIGSLTDAEQAYVCEGFATGASIYLATGVPVIVAMNADNLKKVVREYKRVMPDLQLLNAADNDAWKPHVGNKGMMTALELHKDLNVRAVYPIFSELDEEQLKSQPTDWNDLHCIAGLKEVTRQIKARTNKLKAEAHYFEYCLQRLRYAGQKNATDEALKAVGAGMMLSPIVYSSDEVYRWVMNSIPAGCPVNDFKIRGRIMWLAKGKLHNAKSLRSFSNHTLDKSHINYIRLEGVQTEHGNVLLPDTIVDLVDSLQGCIILRAPMGSGKTERLIQPVMHRENKAAYIAHRISLIGDASNRLGIANYQETMAVEMPYTTHLACCVNSIVNPKFQNSDGLSWFETVDTLCIDEASQVLRHTANGPVDNPVRVMDGLVAAMRSSRRVVMCDADANDALVELCEMARPGEPIHVIEVEGSCNHINVLHTDIDSAFGEVVKAVGAGKKVLVADDSANDGKKMVEVLLAKKPDLKVLHVHKDSKADAAVESFLNNPNAQCVHYDVVIYSPAISSGVSITVRHFDVHVAIFHGVVPPTDAVQMMRRDRTARQYILGIGINNTQRETDREAIYRGLVAADEFTVDYEETDEEIILRRRKTIFDEVRLGTIAEENRARNDFANNLLLIMVADGYRVGRMAKDMDDINAAKAMKEYGKAIVEQKRIDMVLSQETPDEETFHKLSRSEVRSVEESAQVDRYHMENQLCVENITPEVIDFYDDRGIKKVAAMELLQSKEEDAIAYDRAQIKNKVVITRHNYKRATRHQLVTVFEQLGLDRMTGEGEFTHRECRAVMNELLKDKKSIELYNSLKIGAYVNPRALPKDPTTFVKNIMAKLGLVLHKRKTGGRNKLYVAPASWQAIMEYVDLRAAKGVSSLQFVEKDAPAPVASDKRAGLETATEQPEAAPHVASVGGDTSANKVIYTVEKYPQEVELDRDLIIRTLSEAIAGTSVTLEQARGWLSREDLEDIQLGELTVDQLKFYFKANARRLG